MYGVLRAKGLSTPEITGKKSVKDSIDDLLAEHIDISSITPPEPVSDEPMEDMPDELREWLGKSIVGMDPDDLYEKYDELKEKYRPVTGHDPTTWAPMYDDTYLHILNKIIARFEEYEDSLL